MPRPLAPLAETSTIRKSPLLRGRLGQSDMVVGERRIANAGVTFAALPLGGRGGQPRPRVAHGSHDKLSARSMR
ncbi:hypothetical protein SAMN05216337_10424 [Bradyrhizobium brasilense]|uniref:Uncharacterized protein n=1 Tax=Bradyrhizobium brasilense TaxID=1419277 RepID=A0A1G7HHZ9_9BRAD|nr:hypothetical protein SAMN05216337_10424 [Bradyrhizobium brasilense]